jgi:hypothetical protein
MESANEETHQSIDSERLNGSLMSKLNLHDRIDVVKYALRKGLIDV